MPNSRSADWESLKMEQILEGTVAGLWALPLVGTPDQVAQQIVDLHESGLDGVAFSWPDFDEGLEQLETSILPRLVEAGVRAPVTGGVTAGTTAD
jgi:alkanesulfonate monooxygenase SsuD/methylene tetrahydromethanopterin reductase-like flavin-dependent oxidoreductase (luciferase family)